MIKSRLTSSLLALGTLLIASPVWAISDADRHAVLYQSEFYDSQSDTSSCDGGVSAGVASSVNLDPSIVTRINALKDTYVQASQQTHVPWQIYAGIDFEETDNSPVLSMFGGEPLGTPSADHPGVVPKTKLDSIIQATNLVLIPLAQSVYGVDATKTGLSPQEVQEIFIVYNRGQSYKVANTSPDKSPYVMNMYDAAHTNMTYPSIPGETLAGRVDQGRPGAYTIYSRITGSGSGDTCTSSTGTADGNKIVQIAMAEQGKSDVYGPPEAWCADFVSWVYKQAGVPFTGGEDGGWRIPSAIGVYQWMGQNGKDFTNNDPNNSDIPQPGDIVYFNWSGGNVGGGNDHIGIVIRTEGTTLKTINGNWGNRVGEQDYPDFRHNNQIIGWGRLTK